jgi:ABC-type Fe3+ transport system permease subunit
MPGGADPEVAATVRLLHRRQGWGRAAWGFAIAFLLAGGGAYSAASQGTPPPLWFDLVVAGFGVLAVVCIVAVVLDTRALRRRPAEVVAQAGPVAAEHPSRRARHYPPRHRVPWAVAWIGMLAILAVAVVTVPGLVNGVAYLTGTEKMVTFDPVSYSTSCAARGGCTTSTVGTLETGGKGTDATWPDVVPLGQPFKVREPVWRWGLGAALIDSTWIAVVAILISLLLDVAGVFVLFSIVRLARNWLRHRRQGRAPAPAGAG